MIARKRKELEIDAKLTELEVQLRAEMGLPTSESAEHSGTEREELQAV
jgi:hypothetical protein